MNRDLARSIAIHIHDLRTWIEFSKINQSTYSVSLDFKNQKYMELYPQIMKRLCDNLRTQPRGRTRKQEQQIKTKEILSSIGKKSIDLMSSVFANVEEKNIHNQRQIDLMQLDIQEYYQKCLSNQ